MTILTLRRPLGAAAAVSDGGEDTATRPDQAMAPHFRPLDRALAPTARAA